MRKPLREPTLVTERLKLRPLRPTDRVALALYAGDYDIAKMTTRIPHPYTDADAGAHLARFDHPDSISFAIEHAAAFVGGCSLHDLLRKPELGYWIAKPYWGRGFATEAGRALLAFGFDQVALPLVHYRVFIDNPASIRLMDKLGFHRMGTGLSRSLARGGEVAHIHGVLTAARYRAAKRTPYRR